MSWLLAGAQLTTAGFFLFCTGAITSRLLRGLWFGHESPARQVAHCIFLGQLVLVFLTYARSILNHLTVTIPITIFDFIVACTVLGILAYRQQRPNFAVGIVKHVVFRYWPYMASIACVFFLIAWRELPREVMLSSDPDQHAFWAQQVQRFGTLPYFTQGFWGPSDFGYPGGFAVLNFVWATLSGLDVRNTVGVQTLVQVQLAILMLFEALRPRGDHSWKTNAGELLALLLIFCCYYGLLPYGYQYATYHLEGAGRYSAMLLNAAPVSLYVFALKDFSELDRKTVHMWPQALVLGSGAALVVMINITNLPFYFLIATLALAILTIRANAWASLWQVAIAFSTSALFLIDPYYFSRFLLGLAPQTKASVDIPAKFPSFDVALQQSYERLWHHPEQLLVSAFETNLASGSITFVLGTTVAIGLLILWKLRLTQSSAVIAIGTALGTIVFAHGIVAPLFQAVGGLGGDYYLIPVYVDVNRQQFLILVLYAGIILAITATIWSRSPVLIAALILATGAALLTTDNERVGKTARRGYPGPMGSAAPDDFAVIDQIEQEFRRYRTDEASLSFERVPKILIPNALLELGGEKWLFPHGAARILPFYDVFPTAFYYFQGSSEYSFENYLAHVCQNFDREWLLARGIRYLFVPAERGATCIKNFDDVVHTCAPIAARGGSLFCDLSSRVQSPDTASENRELNHQHLAAAGYEKTVPSEVGGFVDQVERDGNTVVIQGWARWTHDNPNEMLHVISEGQIKSLRLSTVERPDVEAHFRDARLRQSGFRLEVDYKEPVHDRVPRICVVASGVAGGADALLANGPIARDCEALRQGGR
jgi:hypothetical protein